MYDCLATEPGLQKLKMAASFQGTLAFRVWTQLFKICRNSALKNSSRGKFCSVEKCQYFQLNQTKYHRVVIKNGKMIMKKLAVQNLIMASRTCPLARR